MQERSVAVHAFRVASKTSHQATVDGRTLYVTAGNSGGGACGRELPQSSHRGDVAGVQAASALRAGNTSLNPLPENVRRIGKDREQYGHRPPVGS